MVFALTHVSFSAFVLTTMPPAKDAKIWNTDLMRAFHARYDQAKRESKQIQTLWREGMMKFQGLTEKGKNIYVARTGKIFNLDNNMKKTIYETARNIIEGRKPVIPYGYEPLTAIQLLQMEDATENEFDDHPYLKKIKSRSGAYAILMAFHYSATKTLTKNQLCHLGQQHCDEEMMGNYHAGRMYGGFKGKDTLKKHDLIIEDDGGGPRNVGGRWTQLKHTYSITRKGEKFTEAMLKKFGIPVGPRVPPAPVATTPLPNFGGFGAPPLAALAGMGIRSPVGRNQVLNRFFGTDDEELFEWIKIASAGDVKSFNVSKNRRKALHDACDKYQRDMPGLMLVHGSAGTSRQRTLWVRMLSKPGDASVAAHLPLSRSVDPESPLSKHLPDFHLSDSSPAKRSFNGIGHTLGGESPAKRTRMTPAQAAAQAALARHACKSNAATNIAPLGENDADFDRVIQESLAMASFKRPPTALQEDYLEIANQESKSASWTELPTLKEDDMEAAIQDSIAMAMAKKEADDLDLAIQESTAMARLQTSQQLFPNNVESAAKQRSQKPVPVDERKPPARPTKIAIDIDDSDDSNHVDLLDSDEDEIIAIEDSQQSVEFVPKPVSSQL
jgi:hypothetical protein